MPHEALKSTAKISFLSGAYKCGIIIPFGNPLKRRADRDPAPFPIAPGVREVRCCEGGWPRLTSPARRWAPRRDGRVVEGARLESGYTGNRIVGSNPTPSANLLFAHVRKTLKKRFKTKTLHPGDNRQGSLAFACFRGYGMDWSMDYMGPRNSIPAFLPCQN